MTALPDIGGQVTTAPRGHLRVVDEPREWTCPPPNGQRPHCSRRSAST